MVLKSRDHRITGAQKCQLHLRRPWRRTRRLRQLDRVMIMTKRNYKVYADIGPDIQRVRRLVSVLDTGAGRNFIRRSELPPGVEDRMRYGPLPDICDANNNPLSMLGIISLPVRLGRHLALVDFVVCTSLGAQAILGADYCDKFVEAIRPRAKLVEMDDGTTVPIVRRVMRRGPKFVALPPDLEYDRTGGRVSDKVRVATSVKIPAHSQTWVQVTTKKHGLVVLQPLPSLFEKQKLSCTNGVVQVEPDRIFKVLIANFAPYEQRVVKNQIVGTILPHPTAVVPSHIRLGEVLELIESVGEEPTALNATKATSSTEEEPAPIVFGPSANEEKNCEPEISVDTLNLDHIDPRFHGRLRSLLHKYAQMWDGTLGEITTTEHHIELLPGTKPLLSHPYRAGPAARKAEKDEVDRMLRAGVIEPAQSAWASPVALVPKQDGSLRFCVDYRRLNSVTVKYSYPLPRMEECLDSLGEATVFTTLDCNSGYWQIPVAAEDRDKTTFSCHAGTYRYKRMPFGLATAPATFQRTLDMVLSKFNWRTCLVYLDDVIIFSEDVESHFVHVDRILSALQHAGVSLNLKKCEFFTNTVKYLGPIIRPGTLSIDETKVVALTKAQHPRNHTELRSFLGFCNVYRRFVQNYSQIAAPLNALLKKGIPLQLEPFGPDEANAFSTLVTNVTNPPVLALPKPGLPYSLDTDASAYQVGAALFQTHDNGERKPIGFWSRTLLPAEKNYSVSERECLAVVFALQNLRPYLQGEKFIVHSDHASLRWLMGISEPSGRLMRWRLRLSEFDFQVVYKKGKLNTQADALSRLTTLGSTVVAPDEDIPCFLIQDSPRPCVHTHCTGNVEDKDMDLAFTDALLEMQASQQPAPELVLITPSDFKREQLLDSFCVTVRSRLNGGERIPFSLVDGVLYRTASEREQLVVPEALRNRVLHLSHYSKLAAHPGGRRLYQYLRSDFYWPSMAVDCYAVARNCISCARNRVLLRKNSKKMQLFPAKAPLEYVAIDILGELIKTPRGYRYLLVISDRFSKLVRTVPLRRITAATVAMAFVKHWVFTYGPPVFVLSDNGKQFTARFFQNVCRILGVSNLFTTTYHPQCNGQVERFHRTIIAALRHYVSDHPKEWDLFTDALTYAYNTQIHRATKYAPFELVLARPPRTLSLQAQPTVSLNETPGQFHLRWQNWLKMLMSTAKDSLHREQRRYKRDFDKRLRLPTQEISAGSYVFVRKEYFGKQNPRHKLSPIAEGPFRVIDTTEQTVVIQDGLRQEKISRDRVVGAPSPATGLRNAVLDSPVNSAKGVITPEEQESVQTDTRLKNARPQTRAQSRKQVDKNLGRKVQKNLAQEAESTPARRTMPSPARDENIEKSETAKAIEDFARQVVTQTSKTSPKSQEKERRAAPIRSRDLPQITSEKRLYNYVSRGLGDLPTVEVEKPLGVITRVNRTVPEIRNKASEPISDESISPPGIQRNAPVAGQPFERKDEEDQGTRPTLLKKRDDGSANAQNSHQTRLPEPSMTRYTSDSVGKRTAERRREQKVLKDTSLTKQVQPDQYRSEPQRRLVPTPATLPPQGIKGRTDTRRVSTPKVFDQEFVIDRLIGHRDVKSGSPQFLVRWYGYADTEATWEPIVHIPRSAILLYCKRIQVPPPDELVLCKAQKG